MVNNGAAMALLHPLQKLQEVKGPGEGHPGKVRAPGRGSEGADCRGINAREELAAKDGAGAACQRIPGCSNAGLFPPPVPVRSEGDVMGSREPSLAGQTLPGMGDSGRGRAPGGLKFGPVSQSPHSLCLE